MKFIKNLLAKVQRGTKVEAPKNKDERPTFENLMQPFWQDGFDAYPIGRRFDYLGRQMVIVEHKPYLPGIPGYSPARPATIIAEYVNDSGEIKQHEFSAATIRTILL